jgi:hypothetical protein
VLAPLQRQRHSGTRAADDFGLDVFQRQGSHVCSVHLEQEVAGLHLPARVAGPALCHALNHVRLPETCGHERRQDPRCAPG